MAISGGRARFARSIGGGFAPPTTLPITNNDIETAPVQSGGSPRIDDDPEAVQCELAKGNCSILILADAGGVWQKHNPWLRDLPSPLRMVAVDKADFIIELRKASTWEISGQWTMSPSALEIMRRLTGRSRDASLSLLNQHSVVVRIVAETADAQPAG